mgnify:CR=1 FL=1
MCDSNFLKNQILKLIEEPDKNDEQRLDQFLECINKSSIDGVLNWLENIKANLPAEVTEMNLNEVNDGWVFNQETGNLEHKTGGFFKVIGVRTETSIRESGKGWNQPMVDQGTEASVVGLVKHNNKYLIEAKFEPGNYGEVLLSPTLQVTYDNLNKLHSGRKPLYSEYFDGTIVVGIDVKFEHWYPEDGGRFYKKRVKNMLVEIDNEIKNIPQNFIWLTMYQLKELLKLDNIMNPHLRSIISYL